MKSLQGIYSFPQIIAFLDNIFDPGPASFQFFGQSILGS